ncbi:MAG: CheR family methyltransferase [Alphaproteobacteria bacterium]
MTPADFEFISTVLHKRSGLVLTPEKIYLLESRLTPLARRLGHASLQALIAAIRKSAPEDVLVEITEAMTTNESFFFRDKAPFEQFERLMIPTVRGANTGPLRVWCAAASTGQEPYSLSMVLSEKPALLGDQSIDILATDLSREVLERATKGVYTQFEVQRGLAVQMLIKYFEKTGDHWRIKPTIREMVRYKCLNLLHDFSDLGTFDIIFCRNVLIYFDRETKTKVLNRLAAQLAPHGFLVLGAAETIFGLTDRFKPVNGERGLYEAASAERTMPLAAAG